MGAITPKETRRLNWVYRLNRWRWAMGTLPAAELFIDADGPKIEQVILNLLQNAIEAMATTGGGTATVRARRQPRFALLEIEDQGPGLPDAHAPVFDAFYSTKPDGTGLGLAIVSQLAQACNATVELRESDTGGIDAVAVFRSAS